MVRTIAKRGAGPVFLGAMILGGFPPTPASASAPQAPPVASVPFSASVSATYRAGECSDQGEWRMTRTGVSIWLPRVQIKRGDSPSCWLKVGSGRKYNSDRSVLLLQMHLRDCNGQKIAADGAYGPATRRAVMNVQKRYGLEQDGVYGPKTRNAMKWRTMTPAKKCVKFSSKGVFVYD